MIEVTGSITRAFIFPARAGTTLQYYGELVRIIQFMPHISLVEVYAPHQIRVLYKTVELGSYTLRIFCDLTNSAEPGAHILRITPLTSHPPVEAQASLNSTTAQGKFALEAQLFDLDGQTRIEYHIQLAARLPRPLGMRMMPRRIVNRIAQNITDSRIREIADGFIKASIEAFPEWQAENELAR